MSTRDNHVRRWLEEHRDIGDNETPEELEHYDEVLHKDRDVQTRKTLTDIRHNLEDYLEKKKFKDEFDYLDDIDENDS